MIIANATQSGLNLHEPLSRVGIETSKIAMMIKIIENGLTIASNKELYHLCCLLFSKVFVPNVSLLDSICSCFNPFSLVCSDVKTSLLDFLAFSNKFLLSSELTEGNLFFLAAILSVIGI
jgi:hypothetical protein